MTPKVSTLDQIKNISAELDAWEESLPNKTVMLVKEPAFSLLDDFKDMVVVTDKDGIIKFANPQSFRVLGYEPSELIGKSVDILSSDSFTHKSRISEYLASKKAKILGVGRSVVAKNKIGFSVNAYLYVNELKGEDEPLFVGVLHKV